MLDSTTDTQKLIITCRFIQHDQWLTTHVQPQWTIRQLKLWLVHKLFGISIPARAFTVPQSGHQPERPPSPITFAPDPRNRPASPIIFAAPQKGGFYGSAGGGAAAGGDGGNSGGRYIRGILSDTDEDLLSGSESDFSSVGGRGKGKGRMDEIRIETGPPGSSGGIPGGRIGPSHSDTESIAGRAIVSPTAPAGYTPADADRFPGGVNSHHWTITRYSTGQILGDDEQLSWYDIAEFELLELHGLSFPSTHTLYEYQVCHLWNPDRHRERERLRKKLKKRFEAEATRAAKDKDKDKDGASGSNSAVAKRALIHAQILKAMNLNSGAGANVGVTEYYGHKLGSTQVELTLTRIPRSIDLYVQPYWEGWVRTLRIVWKGDWDDIALVNATSGHSIPLHPLVQHHPAHTQISAAAAIAGTGGGSGGGMLGTDPYKYGAYAAAGTMASGLGMGVSVFHGHAGTSGVPIGATGDSEMRANQKIVRVEWRERWVKIQNGTLIVLKDREDEEATHVLPLNSLLSIKNTQHLNRYLSYTGFNPPLDHPSVNPDILIPALNLPIQRPPMPTGYSSHYANSHSHSSSKSKNTSSTSHNYIYPDSSDDSDSLHHRPHSRHGHSGSGHHHGYHSGHSSAHGHHTSIGGSGSERGHKATAYNFNFPSNQHLQAHMKARELTPLVGSRFDPTYLPVTIDEQKASGLRVVCLQFRKYSSSASGRSGSSYHRDDGTGDRGQRNVDNRDVDPITFALEDMKERASEWGGIRSDNILWKCPENNEKLRREPPYLVRVRANARARMGKLRSAVTPAAGSRRNNGGLDGRSVRSSGARSSTIRGVGDSASSIGTATYYDYLGYHATSNSSKRSLQSHSSSSKQRYYDREQRRHNRRIRGHVGGGLGGDVDLHGILAAQIIGGGVPGTGKYYKDAIEEKERRERKERRKREKELEKERAKQEKKDKEKGKEKGKEKEKEEKDWNLGALNVGFWNWGKKKKAKKEREELRRQQEQQQQLATSGSNTTGLSTPIASSSTLQLNSQRRLISPSVTSLGTTSTVTTATHPTASSTTVVGRGSRGIGAGGSVDVLGGGPTPSSDDDDDDDDDGQIEFAQYETSTGNTTEDEDDEDIEEDEEEEEEDELEEDEDNEHAEDDNVVESYPGAVPERRRALGEEEEDESELIEYANQPSTATASTNPGGDDDGSSSKADHGTNSVTPKVPSVVVQIAVDKRVETESSERTEPQHKPNTVIFGRSIVPSPRATAPPTRFLLPAASSSSPKISIDTSVKDASTSGEAGDRVVTKKRSQRLIGQLHSSDEEDSMEDHERNRDDDEEELSSPVFAPPPHIARRRPLNQIRSSTPSSNPTGSVSSHQSNTSLDGSRDGHEEGGEDYDFDDDLYFEDEYFGPRRATYRYGTYDVKRDEDRKRRVGQLEEEREKRIKELKMLEEKERERERLEREREREKIGRAHV